MTFMANGRVYQEEPATLWLADEEHASPWAGPGTGGSPEEPDYSWARGVGEAASEEHAATRATPRAEHRGAAAGLGLAPRGASRRRGPSADAVARYGPDPRRRTSAPVRSVGPCC